MTNENKAATPDQQLKDLFSKYRKPQSRNSEEDEEPKEKQSDVSSEPKKTGFQKPVFARKSPDVKEDVSQKGPIKKELLEADN